MTTLIRSTAGSLLKGTDIALQAARSNGATAMSWLTLRVRAARTRLDPSTAAWIAETDRLISSGEVDRLLAEQSDPRTIFEQHRTRVS